MRSLRISRSQRIDRGTLNRAARSYAGLHVRGNRALFGVRVCRVLRSRDGFGSIANKVVWVTSLAGTLTKALQCHHWHRIARAVAQAPPSRITLLGPGPPPSGRAACGKTPFLSFPSGSSKRRNPPTIPHAKHTIGLASAYTGSASSGANAISMLITRTLAEPHR